MPADGNDRHVFLRMSSDPFDHPTRSKLTCPRQSFSTLVDWLMLSEQEMPIQKAVDDSTAFLLSCFTSAVTPTYAGRLTVVALFARRTCSRFSSRFVCLIQPPRSAQVRIDLAFPDIVVGMANFMTLRLVPAARCILTIKVLILLMRQPWLILSGMTIFSGSEKAGHVVLALMVIASLPGRYRTQSRVPWRSLLPIVRPCGRCSNKYDLLLGKKCQPLQIDEKPMDSSDGRFPHETVKLVNFTLCDAW